MVLRQVEKKEKETACDVSGERTHRPGGGPVSLWPCYTARTWLRYSSEGDKVLLEAVSLAISGVFKVSFFPYALMSLAKVG